MGGELWTFVDMNSYFTSCEQQDRPELRGFLREDFTDLGGYDQVGRALRDLTGQGELVRVGYGLYSRAARSMMTGAPIPVGGLKTLWEALNRVGIATAPARMERAYNAGETTQVPTSRVVAVNRRVRRKIGYGGMTLDFERD